MKKVFYLVLISLILASCNSPAPVETVIPTLPPTQTQAPTQIPKPTSTPIPTLTPTPEPTNTPEPVAVQLVYKGWTDKAYSHVCVDSIFVDVSENPIPGVTDVDVPARMKEAAKALLTEMGMQIVPIAETCESLYVFSASTDIGMKIEYRPNGDVCIAYKKVEATGDFIVMAPPMGGDGFVIPFSNSFTIKEETYNCNQFTEPPYDSTWPKIVIDSFVKVYGPAVIQAALKIPELQGAAEAMK